MSWTVTNGWLRNQLLRILALGHAVSNGNTLIYNSTTGQFIPGAVGTPTLPLAVAVDGDPVIQNADGDNILSVSADGTTALVPILAASTLVGAGDPATGNTIAISGDAAGNAPMLSAGGVDTDVSIQIQGKGTGTINLNSNVVADGTANVLVIPTSDPHVVGALWNNLGVPAFSAG